MTQDVSLFYCLQGFPSQCAISYKNNHLKRSKKINLSTLDIKMPVKSTMTHSNINFKKAQVENVKDDKG